MKDKFKQIWAERAKLLEDHLQIELNNTPTIDENILKAMTYSLFAGGKRVRPVMMMAAADAIAGNGEKFLPVACALEMIHTYSLIHDDLPAMDNDDYRRGKLTNHKVFGEATAILAGDALLTHAFDVMTRQDADPAMLITVIREISQAAGIAGMVGGQSIDLQSEGQRVNLKNLRRMHLGKTGALFRASIRSGAILAGANDKQLEELTQYAENFGLAFQITDDILDITGDEKILGKPVGSDKRNKKSTYVTLMAPEEARILAELAVESAIDALKNFDDEADFLRALVEFLIKRDK
ncbi:MAG: polyprenyl synthetase family protein [Selenomonadaceae bacterium]|nr:polyprenyl synthetase family protein [Selenomonadaceae bacterium]